MDRSLSKLVWMLTQGNRVEEVQREEEIGGSACIDGKNCTTYYICVEILAFGGRYGHARSIRWLSFRKKCPDQQQEEECNAFHHEVCSLLHITRTEHLHLYEYLRTGVVPFVESNAMHLLLPGFCTAALCLGGDLTEASNSS